MGSFDVTIRRLVGGGVVRIYISIVTTGEDGVLVLASVMGL